MFHLTEKSGKPGTASTYWSYITREWCRMNGRPTPDLKGCFFGSLPNWAKGDPQFFFQQADLHERVNGAAFRALELSLPRQLTLEQGTDMMLELIPEILERRPWFMAIHCSVGALAGELNPHCHLMFSDRACDGIPRSPSQYFHRANPAFPELGGAAKLSGGKPPSQMGADLRALRETVAAHMNQTLIRHGFQPTIDHRSHRERGLDHSPEAYLGRTAVRSMTTKERDDFLAARVRRSLAELSGPNAVDVRAWGEG